MLFAIAHHHRDHAARGIAADVHRDRFAFLRWLHVRDEADGMQDIEFVVNDLFGALDFAGQHLFVVVSFLHPTTAHHVAHLVVQKLRVIPEIDAHFLARWKPEQPTYGGPGWSIGRRCCYLWRRRRWRCLWRGWFARLLRPDWRIIQDRSLARIRGAEHVLRPAAAPSIFRCEHKCRRA